MCEKCRRLDPEKDVVLFLRTHEPGTQDEFKRQYEPIRCCPYCMTPFKHPRKMICSAVDEDKKGSIN